MNKKTVMLVMDFDPMRQFLGKMLKEAGYDVVDACNGTEALAQLAKSKIDLVISDLDTQHTDGIVLKNEMMRLPEHRFTPILMMSSESEAPALMPEDEVDGGQAWLVKPFRFDKFFGTVSRLICA